MRCFGITPKAYLAFKLRILSLKRAEKVWKDLAKFVRKEALKNGLEDGVPCLVLDDKGGTCITVHSLVKNVITSNNEPKAVSKEKGA